MYTTFEVNTSVSLTVPTHIKGQSSGATAFLRYSSVGTGFTAYDVKGTFFGERLSFDGFLIMIDLQLMFIIMKYLI